MFRQFNIHNCLQVTPAGDDVTTGPGSSNAWWTRFWVWVSSGSPSLRPWPWLVVLCPDSSRSAARNKCLVSYLSLSRISTLLLKKFIHNYKCEGSNIELMPVLNRSAQMSLSAHYYSELRRQAWTICWRSSWSFTGHNVVQFFIYSSKKETQTHV